MTRPEVLNASNGDGSNKARQRRRGRSASADRGSGNASGGGTPADSTGSSSEADGSSTPTVYPWEKEVPKKGCRRPRKRVVHRDLAADYVRSPYFTAGYRICRHHWDAVKSLLYWHVDSLDAWTSIFAVVHGTALLLYAMYYTEVFGPESSGVDHAVFYLFYAVSWLHGPASAMYHLFGCAGISEETFLFYQRLDYVMIFFSSVPLAFSLGFYVFHVKPLLLLVSILGVTVTAVHVASKLTIQLTPAMRIKQMAVLVLCYMLPIAWQIVVDFSEGNPLALTSVSGIIAIVSLGLGAYCYGVKWPECSYPDSPISAHTLMHVGVHLAYFFEFLFILEAFRRARHEDQPHGPHDAPPHTIWDLGFMDKWRPAAWYHA